MQTDGHFSPAELEEYHLGQIDADDRVRVEAHLEWCELCADRVMAIERFFRLAEERDLPRPWR